MLRCTPYANAARAAVALSALVLTACAQSTDSGSGSTLGTVAPAPTTPPPVTTSAPPATGLLPGESGGDPVYPEDTAPTTEPLVTVPPSPSSTSTTAAPTSTAPPTTEPVSLQELVLSGEGIGSAIFGTDPEGVVAYVTSILGSNTADSGWVQPETFGYCPGTTVRRVDWGVLSLLFSDASQLVTGRRHLIGWEYGRIGQIGDEPAGLHTAGGVTLGSRVVDVLAEFPDATLVEGDPELELPDQFFVDARFSGWLSGMNADDFVTVMFGGERCGG